MWRKNGKKVPQKARKGVFWGRQKNCITKLAKFSLENLLFSRGELKSREDLIFEQNILGKLQAKIPFKALAKKFDAYLSTRPKGGRPPHLGIEGGLALMFLKHYLNLSDAMLVERLNSDIFLQLFCFTRIPLHQPIRDKDLVGRWRRFFGDHLDIQSLQDVLADHWKPYLEQTHVLMDDATCYESYIKYPTDVKLLGDCVEWLFREMCKASTFHKVALPKMEKYDKAMARLKGYQKLRRKPPGKEKRLRRSLLYWIKRWEEHLQHLLNLGSAYHKQLSKSYYSRIKTIRIIAQQQRYMLLHDIHKVPHRIVSLHKPYIRPIIRGKEGKPYEFGAKVHMSQVDGLNFIEHLSFEAFHEGNRMWYSMARHKKRFEPCTHYAADSIYATNANRKKAKKRGVHTSFVRKGPKAKDEAQRQQMRSTLAKARSTRLEGSFGTEKQHYGVQKVKAKRIETEITWIFFAVHTANAVRLTRRVDRNKVQATQQARAA